MDLGARPLATPATAEATPRLAGDARSLDGLRRTARDNPDAALRQAAKQFEAVFMRMLLTSMRESLPGDPLTASSGGKMATGMLDDQWAQQLSSRGLGLADLMVRQLAGKSQSAAAGATLERLRAATLAVDGEGTAAPGAVEGDGGAPSAPPAASLLRSAPAATLSRANAALAAYGLQTGAAGLPVPPRTEGSGAAPRPAAVSATPAVPAPSSTPTEAGSGRAGGASALAPAESGTPASGSPRDFIRRLRSHAEHAGEAAGIPAHFILGQAALESGWGKREIRMPDGGPSHNLFGIKAGRGWTGATVEATTTEYVNGVAHRTVERFRAYGSYTEAFADYARLLKSNARYSSALEAGGDGQAFAQRIAAGGYATDPAYARKLSATINQALALQGAA